MVTQSEIKTWKKKADSGDAESAFLIYITHTDPATGAPQDWDVAWKYLNIAFDKQHPDATLIMGTQYVSGERIEKDLDKGIALMQRAKSMGCQHADQMASMLGVDLQQNQTTKDVGEVNIASLGLSCVQEANKLVESGTIAPMQQAVLMSIVQEYVKKNDVMGVMNIYGIMQSPEELRSFLDNAGNITDSDSASATFFVDNKSKSSNTKNMAFWAIGIAVLFVLWFFAVK